MYIFFAPNEKGYPKRYHLFYYCLWCESAAEGHPDNHIFNKEVGEVWVSFPASSFSQHGYFEGSILNSPRFVLVRGVDFWS
jgi:hypothetical protein